MMDTWQYWVIGSLTVLVGIFIFMWIDGRANENLHPKDLGIIALLTIVFPLGLLFIGAMVLDLMDER